MPGQLDLTPFFQLADAGSGEENRYESWPPKHHQQILFPSTRRDEGELAYAQEVVAKFMRRAYLDIIGRWFPQSGYDLAPDPVVEHYLNDPARTPGAALRTEVRVRILEP